MTDLKDKTVEELLAVLDAWRVPYPVVQELARRLEEAQQKSISQPAGWVRIVVGHSGPVAAEVEWQTDKPSRSGLWRALYMDDHSEAHDAEVAAKVLEEFREVYPLLNFMETSAWLDGKIAKYRAQAGRKE